MLLKKISDNLTSHLKEPEKGQKLKVSRRKYIIKVRAEVNQIETKNREKINETESMKLIL